jgi:hypothetical protein
MSRLRCVLTMFIFTVSSAAAAVACTGDDPVVASDGSGDASAPDSATADVGPDGTAADSSTMPDAAAPSCDVGKPFGLPQIVANVNIAQADDSSAHLTPDELELYFSSTRIYNEPRLWHAKRSSKASAFGTPSLVPINVDGGGVLATSPTIRPDGLYLFFEAVPPPINVGSQRTILVLTRATTAASFSAPAPITAIQTPGEGDPSLTTGGTALYYVIDLQHHIFTATAKGDGFDAPAPVNGLATPVGAQDSAPVASEDGMTLYFASDRADAAKQGGTEIWLARRSSLASDFSAPVLVPELNGAEDDAPSWLSPDRCTIYFTSKRLLAPSDPPDLHHLYYATRTP